MITRTSTSTRFSFALLQDVQVSVVWTLYHASAVRPVTLPFVLHAKSKNTKIFRMSSIGRLRYHRTI
jgi:hypothetical protein